ncbi:MAG TPA: hypothetical protein VFA28_10990 [Bryobacteraceae bacterium]|nr:hypothetical protein [Bryobacteraceae bacterium]
MSRISRREFGATLAGAAVLLKAAEAAADFPPGDYTPFGYLDNPHHAWNLHPSGVIRSINGIGFGFYYPAGPGGYFDYRRNNVYRAILRLGFVVGGKRFWSPADFAPGQLSASHHSKNLFTYRFRTGGLEIAATFAQVNEDALVAHIRVTSQDGAAHAIRVIAEGSVALGGAAWWGRDGLVGVYDGSGDYLSLRPFAAGPVFAVAADRASAGRTIGTGAAAIEKWMAGAADAAAAMTYYPEPLHGALRYELSAGSNSPAELTVTLARSTNLASAAARARSSLSDALGAMERKRAEDRAFWDGAPQLAGDWPKHWRNGWIYDFETLRMMVRRPVGVYRHAWDAMQIQAPRNVLAETSIDAWALSYAAPDLGKALFAGQFLDALQPNIPCMREDGEMNMIAADGAECGTSISWCYPYFCAASIFDRTRDEAWLRQVYPGLARLLRWTLANRRDAGGFLVGKCSWETGMDASKRFLIRQPTGGELTEFIRLVELQAAAAQAGAILARFAPIAGDAASVAEWREVQRTFTGKTQALWLNDWFHDYDTRSKKLVTETGRDPAQAAPAFCGAAAAEQIERMRATLRQFYERSKARAGQPAAGWDDGLAWSSIVLPYLESVWSAGDRELAAEVVMMIADRIYRSMDRRRVEEEDASGLRRPRLGWPGVSCEIWGAQGAFGGEGYGWGAVMPAHIVRSVIGFRETEQADAIQICPNFPAALAVGGKRYEIRGLHYGGDRFDIAAQFNAAGVRVEIAWRGATRIVSASEADGKPLRVESRMQRYAFDARNHARYLLRLERGRN